MGRAFLWGLRELWDTLDWWNLRGLWDLLLGLWSPLGLWDLRHLRGLWDLLDMRDLPRL